MKKISVMVIPVVILAAAGQIFAADYYVDSNYGNDSSDGTSPETAWQRLDKVNSFQFVPGDRIFFARGGEWRGNLKLQSGSSEASLYYGAYGKGKKPLIMGSTPLSSPVNWVSAGENLWVSYETATPVFGNTDVGNLILNGKKAAFKKWKKEDLVNQDDFWFDLKGDKRIYYYSKENPGKLYIDIEAAIMRNVVDYSNSHYVTIDGLDIRYGAAHGFGGGETSFITIRNCDISWIGGGDQRREGGEGKRTRYGNGIEFWGEAHDCLVEKNKLWEIYDAALTNQGMEGNTEANITYRENLIWNCEYSFEYWNGETSKTENIFFEKNLCFDAGYGWGHIQRPNPNGRCVMMYRNAAKTENLVIRDNVFCNATESLIRVDRCDSNPGWPQESMVLDGNQYFNQDGQPYFLWLGKTYSGNDFSLYQKETGNEQNGVNAPPETTIEHLKYWNKVY